MISGSLDYTEDSTNNLNMPSNSSEVMEKKESLPVDKIVSLITTGLSGMMGGALLGFDFGVNATIIGGFIGTVAVCIAEVKSWQKNSTNQKVEDWY